VREAFIFLEILANQEDAAALRDWVAYKQPDSDGRGWKAPKRNAPVYRSIREGGLLTVARMRELAAQPASQLHGSGRGDVHRRIVRLIDLLDAATAVDVRAIVETVLDEARWEVEESASPELARNDMRRLRREALRILDQADEDVPLSRLVEELRGRIATREPIGEEESPGIEIVTLWGAKGLTADFTYIVGLCDEALPGPHNEEETGLTAGEYNLEQQRLLYVSLTRAKRALVISRPRKIKRGEVPALGLERRAGVNPWWQDLHVCRFLSDLPPAALPASVAGEEWQGLDLD
jgi:superfamily I DNA/RNA helicase